MGRNAAGVDTSRRDRNLLIAGFIIFCNPVLGLVDILPDAVGALLIFAGLARAAFSNESIDRARKIALWIAAAEGIKLLLTVPVHTSGVSTNVLTAVAFSVVAEAILFVIFFHSFFSGVDEEATKNGYPKTIERFPGARFTAFVFTGIRLAANLIPALFAIPEVDRNGEDISFEAANRLNGLLSAKPFITVFCMAGALVAGVWFVFRISGLTAAFFREAGNDISETSVKRFYSDPEKTSLRRLKFALFAINAGVFFAFDLSFDGKRILPVYAMYALIFAAAFLLPGKAGTKQTKIFSAAAFVLNAANVIYATEYVVTDPVVFFETEIKTAAVAAALSLLAATAGLLAVRSLLSDISAYSEDHGADFRHTLIWVLFFLSAAVSALLETLPYLSKYLNFPRIAIVAAFIFCFWRENTYLLDSERKRIALIPKDEEN